MRYERMQDPILGLKCFRTMSQFIEQFSELASQELSNRPDLFYNLGGMLACVLYVRAQEDLTWISPFVSGVNSFMDELSKGHRKKNLVDIAFQHPDVPQA